MAEGKVMVFDLLDTLQGFKGAPKGKHKPFYQAHLARAEGQQVEEFLARTPYLAQLELYLRELQAGNLEPVALPGSKEVLQYVNEAGMTPIIVSADLQENVEMTGGPFINAKLVDPENAHGVATIGAKADAETWSRSRDLHFPGTQVIGVFEDSLEYIQAAQQAYGSWGFHADETATLIRPMGEKVISGNLHNLSNLLRKSMIEK